MLALLRSLPEVIGLLKSLDLRARSSADQKIGYDGAVKQGLLAAQRGAESDAASDTEARSDHARHPTGDGGLDTEFRRTL